MREELGHLHTGWLLTRHPEAGVGAIGLDWGRHRDITLARCKMITAAGGCTPNSGHRDRTQRSWPADHQHQVDAHLAGERAERDSAGITAAAEQAATAAFDIAHLTDPTSAERAARSNTSLDSSLHASSTTGEDLAYGIADVRANVLYQRICTTEHLLKPSAVR